MLVEKLVNYIENHSCFSHPIFKNWVRAEPSVEVVSALFHQIRSFCDSTRPVYNLAENLVKNGFSKESDLIASIAESEKNHGPELATMAGHIINKMSANTVFDNLYDQQCIENYMKEKSDLLLERLPGYDKKTGLLIQTKASRNVFEGRKEKGLASLLKNLGATLALEIISHRQLIPGEKYCLVDSKLYGVSLEDEEMHYLSEHWGEAGAEAMHEEAVYNALKSIMDTDNNSLVFLGASLFLESLSSLWDVLDASLLGSGHRWNEAA